MMTANEVRESFKKFFEGQRPQNCSISTYGYQG